MPQGRTQGSKSQPLPPPPPEWEIIHALPNPVGILDSQGRILFVNAAWGEASLGARYLDVCRKRGRAPFLPAADAISTGLAAVLCGSMHRFACEYSARCPVGRSHRYSLTITPLPEGRGVLVAHSDLGEEAIVAAPPKTLIQTLLSEAADAVFVCDTKERLIVSNPATSHWVGVDLALQGGKSVGSIVAPELAPFFLDRHAATIERGETYTYETTARTIHGVRSFNITKGVCRTPKGKVQGVFTVARDITERKAMEREIIETSDKEKQRLGQDLHENLCQYLVGISLLGNVLFEDLLRLELQQAEDARQITSLVKDAITEVRALAKGLAPMQEEQEEGLISALQELASQARAIGKVRCTVRLPRSVDFVNPTTGGHLFRIAQEGVHNALKHAQASRISIGLSVSRRAIALTVQDDGVGISSEATGDSEISSRLGLHIMKYRSRAIGAELSITPGENGRGTLLSCTLPRR